MEHEEEGAGIKDGRGPHTKNEPVKSTDSKYTARVMPQMPKGENVPREAKEAGVFFWLIPLPKSIIFLPSHCSESL